MENIYLPRELFTEEFKDYSNEAKLAFSILLTDSEILSNAISVTDLMSVARLIDTLGKDRLQNLKKNFQRKFVLGVYRSECYCFYTKFKQKKRIVKNNNSRS